MGKAHTVPKHQQRARVRAEFLARGFAVESRTGRGVLPGARLRATREGETFEVAVKCSLERSLGFSRKPNGRWRTLDSVDWLAAIVPAPGGSEKFQIYCFDTSSLVEAYDHALSGMRKAGRAPSLEMPVYVPLDRASRKNVGHHEAGLKELAKWTVEVEIDRLEPVVVAEGESFVQRVKREFAVINQVDISKVQVEFRIVD
jgi:hypothetical protein